MKAMQRNFIVYIFMIIYIYSYVYLRIYTPLYQHFKAFMYTFIYIQYQINILKPLQCPLLQRAQVYVQLAPARKLA